jgi:NADP-dependent 3-hydroxy acid dehydrogenase YdfG
MSNSIEGKVVAITGASSGLGEVTAAQGAIAGFQPTRSLAR